MLTLKEVHVEGVSIDRLAPIVGSERTAKLQSLARQAKAALAGRTVLNVNATAAGGGVAEMMQVLLAYARGSGINSRWIVIQGEPDFFAITKRIHNGLHGSIGDGGPLGRIERACYERVLGENAKALKALIRHGDIVILHDPQTAGLIKDVQQAGAICVWRCHIGTDNPNAQVDRSWDFLRSYLEGADAYVFTRADYVPRWMDPGRTHIIQPSIDAFSAKNVVMSRSDVEAILGYVGLTKSDGNSSAPPFTRSNGSLGRINRFSDIMQTGPPPPAQAPLVVQVSRWDRLKDMAGVMEGFARYADRLKDAHLMLVGPVVTGVADDPEGGEVLAECVDQWRQLPDLVRHRVHLATLPLTDRDENAAIVNAIQRHAAVVVQKSIAEGFGLTVTEAMWKARPIVASAVGGIPDQIVDGQHGLLLGDPHDLRGFGQAISRLLEDHPYAEQLGNSAQRRAVEKFLGDRHLEQYARLFQLREDTSAG